MKTNKEHLVRKWLADELTEAELEIFKKMDDYSMHSKIIEGAQYFKAPDVSKEANIEELYSSKGNNENTTSRKSFDYKMLFKIAATITIVLGVSYFFFLNNDQTFSTLASEKHSLELPDNSEVVLNAKSEIVFNKNEWKDKREVHLKGEAFFRVKKGSAFDVVTEKGKITVLGTQFSVKNRANFFEVICYEGLVNVKHAKDSRNLPAGSTLRIVDGITTFETVDFNRPQWLNNVSSFKSVPFYQVIKEFERQYDVTVNAENIDTKRFFTGGFVHNNMQDGLKSITLPLDLNYTIDTNKNITLRKKEE